MEYFPTNGGLEGGILVCPEGRVIGMYEPKNDPKKPGLVLGSAVIGNGDDIIGRTSQLYQLPRTLLSSRPKNVETLGVINLEDSYPV